MENFILFFNSFLSYLLLMIVIAVLCGIAIFTGIKLRKRKDNQLRQQEAETAEVSEN